MGMDIVGNGIDPFRDRIFRLFRMVDVAVLKMVQPEKKLREDTVQEQFGRICELLGPGMAGKVYVRFRISIRTACLSSGKR